MGSFKWNFVTKYYYYYVVEKEPERNSGLTGGRTLAFETTGGNALSSMQVNSPFMASERSRVTREHPSLLAWLLALSQMERVKMKLLFLIYEILFTAGEEKWQKKKNNNCHSLASYTWVDGINWPPPRDWEAIFNVSIAIPLVERLEALWVVCGLYIE